MNYDVQFLPEAEGDLRALRKSDATKIFAECMKHLSHEPMKVSKSRIKKLRGGVFPPYRLRVDDFRVFYNVDEQNRCVVIYGIAEKADADLRLRTMNEGENS